MIRKKESASKDKIIFPRWICNLIVIIALLEILFIIFLCIMICFSPDISSEKAMTITESSLLANGIAIIGIAVAVWTGLNIVNTLERREFEKLKEQTNIVANEYLSLSRKLIDRECKYNTAEQAKWINELSKTANDTGTRKLINLINSYIPEETISITELVEVERYFSLVYNLHNSSYKRDLSLLSFAQKGINIINKYLKISTKPELITYLNFRKAEFYFYSGYCLEGIEKRKAFEKAIPIYFEISDEIGANLPQFVEVENISEIFYERCNTNTEISAYICNTIGEACSKIIEGLEKSHPLLIEYGPKAIFYCAYAVKWSECELYLRNLGCAIERNKGKDGVITNELFEQLYSYYYKALNLRFTANTIKVTVSIIDKHFNEAVGIEPIASTEKRAIPLYDSKYIDNFNDLDISIKNQLRDRLGELHEIAVKGKTVFPSQVVGYTYECIYLRDMAVIEIKNIETAKSYIVLAKKELEYMRLLDPDAPLTKILGNDINDIDSYLASLE